MPIINAASENERPGNGGPLLTPPIDVRCDFTIPDYTVSRTEGVSDNSDISPGYTQRNTSYATSDVIAPPNSLPLRTHSRDEKQASVVDGTGTNINLKRTRERSSLRRGQAQFSIRQRDDKGSMKPLFSVQSSPDYGTRGTKQIRASGLFQRELALLKRFDVAARVTTRFARIPRNHPSRLEVLYPPQETFAIEPSPIKVDSLNSDLRRVLWQQTSDLLCILDGILLRCEGVLLDHDHHSLPEDGDYQKTEPLYECVELLSLWTDHAGGRLRSFIKLAVDLFGEGTNKFAYHRTKEFSIYMWWRICRIAADVQDAISSTPSHSTCKRDINPHPMGEVVVNLHNVLWHAIMNDVYDIQHFREKLDVQVQTEEPGYVSIEDLLTGSDLFTRIPDLHRLPEPESHYRDLGDDSSSNSTKDHTSRVARPPFFDGDRGPQIQLQTNPVLIEDYDYIARGIQRCSRPDVTRKRVKDSGSVFLDQVFSNRAFRNYITRIAIEVRPDVCRNAKWKVIRIYRDLLGRRKSIRQLHLDLQRVLVSAPDLFQEFKKFVPYKLLPKWIKNERHSLYLKQIAEYSHKVLRLWCKQVSQLPTSLTSEKKDTGNLATDHLEPTPENLYRTCVILEKYMASFAAAARCTPPCPLTSEASSKVDGLRSRAHWTNVNFAAVVHKLKSRQLDLSPSTVKELEDQWVGFNTLFQDFKKGATHKMEELDII